MFLKTAAAPAVVVTILFLLFGSAPEPWRSRTQSLILAAGFIMACYLLNGMPAWPPDGGAPSLIYVALWFALYPWVVPSSSGWRFGFRGVWIIVGAAIVLWNLRVSILNSELHCRNILALVCIGWGMWSSLERSIRISHALTPVVMGMVTFTCASVLYLFKSSLLMSQMLTSLAVISGGIAILAWLFPRRLSLHAVFPFLSGFMAVILITGYVFLDIDPWLLASLAIPFLALLVKDLFSWASTSALTDALVMLVLAAIPMSYILWKVSLTSGPLY
jgi:hypothetical protein